MKKKRDSRCPVIPDCDACMHKCPPEALEYLGRIMEKPQLDYRNRPKTPTPFCVSWQISKQRLLSPIDHHQLSFGKLRWERQKKLKTKQPDT